MSMQEGYTPQPNLNDGLKAEDQARIDALRGGLYDPTTDQLIDLPMGKTPLDDLLASHGISRAGRVQTSERVLGLRAVEDIPEPTTTADPDSSYDSI